jgi:tRNA uridine 5-carboxymethylaminomethyl modification enzyme
MFTSRAEYRILLRQDDADLRLTERAYNIGLATKERYELMRTKRDEINRIIDFAKGFSVKPALINAALEQLGTTPLREGCKLADLIERPQLTLQNLADHIKALKAELDKTEPARKDEIIEAAEILMKYSGYISRERLIADKMKRLEDIRIKGRFDYSSLQSLSTECRQKLIKHDPETLAEASRIPGVSPSDINVLLVLLNR